MNHTSIILPLLLAVITWSAAAVNQAVAQDEPIEAQEIDLVTSDSVHIFGDVYESPDDGGVILLFHQGGGNAQAEYASIIPRLLEAGYAVVAIDQRSGGDRLGGTNRTVDALDGREFGYCDARPDLEAALDFAIERDLGHPVIAWGSSYSAALVIQLAALRPYDVDAVLAFSPASGDPMAGCDPTDFLSQVEQPVLALRPAGEMEIERVAAQLEWFAEMGHQTYVSEYGVHGSSMLNEERTEHSTDDVWEVVMDFLNSVE